jgi:hypothetical protein
MRTAVLLKVFSMANATANTPPEAALSGASGVAAMQRAYMGLPLLLLRLVNA